MNRFILLLIALVGWSACSTRQATKTSPEKYLPFYQQFHTDSLFQMERVRFPLDGYSIEGGSIKPWIKDNWVIHKNGLENIDSSIYQTNRTFREELVQEKIFQPDSGVLIERQFSLIEGRWFLTFYLYVFL